MTTTQKIFRVDGRLKYTIFSYGKGSKKVLFPDGTLAGTVVDGKTFDSSGRLVSNGDDVSALIKD